MSGSEQDWTTLGSALALDGALAPFAAEGALLVWSLDGQKLLHANPAGRALLSRGPASLPAAVQERLRLLGSGLATADTVRLERLRLGTGLSGLVTCASKLIESPAGRALALGITGAELRRIGVSIPAEAPPAANMVPASAQAEVSTESAAAEAPAPAVPGRRANLRFLWASDAEGRFTSASPEFAELAGAETAAALPGRAWSQLLGREILDLDGDLAERLATSNTWSGRAVMWRVAPGEGARIELSGFPLFDKERAPAGFRGFGLVRQSENEPFPEPEAIVEPATPVSETAPVNAASTGEDEAHQSASDADLAVPTTEKAIADATKAPPRRPSPK